MVRFYPCKLLLVILMITSSYYIQPKHTFMNIKKNRIMHTDPYRNKQSTRHEININQQQLKGFCTNPFKFQFTQQWWEIQEKEKGFKDSPL